MTRSQAQAERERWKQKIAAAATRQRADRAQLARIDALEGVATQARGAGVDAAVTANGALMFEGRRHALPLEVTPSSPAFTEWSDVVLVREAGDLMRGHLLRAFRGCRAPLKLRRIDRGFVIMHEGRRAAVVTPNNAVVPGREALRADFLRTGRQWAVLRWRVEDSLGVARGPQPLWLDTMPAVVTALPETIADRARRAAVNASRRLKEDRTLVFAHTVALRLEDQSTLRFLPLKEPPAPLEAPFVYSREGDQVEGGLRLRAPGDVLACAISATTDQALIPRAWLTALVAYAALTCVEMHSDPRPAGARAAPLRGDGSRSTVRRAARASSSAGAGSLLPADFVPTGRTREYLASYVVGHRRRLRPNQRHSDEAERAATAVGIGLRENETWVRPHARGVPDDADLEFTWRTPTSIAE